MQNLTRKEMAVIEDYDHMKTKDEMCSGWN